MIPLVSVVFPLPRSPVKRTRTGGCNFAAISRPFAIVSSEECEISSCGLHVDPARVRLSAMFPLRQNMRPRFGNRFNQVGSNQRGLADARRGDIAREAMQVHPK